MIIKSTEIKKNIFKYKCIILHGENLSLKKELEDELLNDYISGTISTILNDPRFKPGQIVQYLNNMPENNRYDTMLNIFEYIFKN